MAVPAVSDVGAAIKDEVMVLVDAIHTTYSSPAVALPTVNMEAFTDFASAARPLKRPVLSR